MVQHHVGRVAQGLDWEVSTASRHFERCFRHDIGARFEVASLDAERNAGLSVITFSGLYFSLSSVYEQMRLISHLQSFKGRYHWTRLDAQVTTLNPSQSAEQIVTDIEERRLWIKGYQGWEPKGLRNLDGEATNGLSAHFGATSSNRTATSYNKAAEQNWQVPARRDEVRLRGEWAEQHTNAIATAIAGAASETQAVEAYQRSVSSTIAQHMQYLDITGTPSPRPKNWTRGRKAPKWWTETLEQEHEPLQLNRRPERDVFERLAHMYMQWGPSYNEGVATLYADGRAATPQQAAFDLAQSFLARLRPEHCEKALAHLPEAERVKKLADLMQAADQASMHSEVA